MNSENGAMIIDEVEHIRQSVRDIVITAIGTRLQRRDYGSYLYQLIDKPVNQALLLQLSAVCVSALRRWEPRIDIERFMVRVEQNKVVAELWAELWAVLKGTQQSLVASLVLREV